MAIPNPDINSALTLSTRADFVEHIKKWVIIDNELKKTAERAKKLKAMRDPIHENICKYMTQNDISNKKIEISDGHLSLADKKEYSPLTYKYIHTCLSEIIPDEAQVDYVIDYLKSHREIKTVTELRRTHLK
jgi:septum formation topological specificity factor MinE